MRTRFAIGTALASARDRVSAPASAKDLEKENRMRNRLATDSDLALASVVGAIKLYKEDAEEIRGPFDLVVSRQAAKAGRSIAVSDEVIAELGEGLDCVVINSLPEGWWYVSGPAGGVGSPGA
jgi:hypothetical protein